MEQDPLIRGVIDELVRQRYHRLPRYYIAYRSMRGFTHGILYPKMAVWNIHWTDRNNEPMRQVGAVTLAGDVLNGWMLRATIGEMLRINVSLCDPQSLERFETWLNT
jgi:hypothetical protein